jgi:hypothetical protein
MAQTAASAVRPRRGCGVLAWEQADPANQFWNDLPKIGDGARAYLGNGE